MASVKKNRKHVALAARCLLAAADLLPPRKAEQKHQQVQRLQRRNEIQLDTNLTLSCMQYRLMLWDRNDVEAALQKMTAAYEAHLHAANQTDPIAISHSLIRILQNLVLLPADVGHWDQAAKFWESRLRSLVQHLTSNSLPKRLSLDTINDQWNLMQGFPG